MSKTLGTIVDPIEAADRRSGVDPLRLYLVKEIAFGGDGDFSWERYDERYNVDLANNLGNLVSRVTAMAHRYRQGRLAPTRRGVGSARAARRAGRRATTARRWTRFALHEGAAAAFRLIDATNEFIAATAPWTLAKDPAHGRSADAGAVRRGGSDPARGRAAGADHAGVEPRDPAPRRRVASDGLSFDRDGRWRNDGERVLAQDGPLWPRKEHDDRDRQRHRQPRSVAPGTDAAAPAPSRPAPRTGTAAPGTAAPGTAAHRPAARIASRSTTS